MQKKAITNVIASAALCGTLLASGAAHAQSDDMPALKHANLGIASQAVTLTTDYGPDDDFSGFALTGTGAWL